MTISSIHTDNAAQPIGPYQQACSFKNILWTSGQIGLHPKPGTLAQDPQAQIQQALDNCQAILQAGNSDWQHVIKATLFTTDMTLVPLINDLYTTRLGNHRPARSCVEVSQLPKGACFEIELIATQEPRM